VLGGWLALSAAPLRAQSVALQASSADGSFVLVAGDGRWLLLEEGRDAILLPSAAGEAYDVLAALDGGWIAAGHRPGADGGRELVLVRGVGGGLETLPAPPSGGAVLASPRPLIENGELAGLVWLEGGDARSLGVRAADWTDGGLGPAQWVAPPSETGSQLALSAAVLADGSWLLLWSAFDGGDDEIRYSRREGPVWTVPARVHADNAVPDITPVVAATSRGAIAAWSRYEAGHYRVRVARFSTGVWGGEERVGGAGSIFPFFVADERARGPHLVFSEVSSGDWQLLELDGSGRVRARSRWRGPAGASPLVRRGAGGGGRLEWLGAAAGAREREP
jgi:hypothetical protein